MVVVEVSATPCRAVRPPPVDDARVTPSIFRHAAAIVTFALSVQTKRVYLSVVFEFNEPWPVVYQLSAVKQ